MVLILTSPIFKQLCKPRLWRWSTLVLFFSSYAKQVSELVPATGFSKSPLMPGKGKVCLPLWPFCQLFSECHYNFRTSSAHLEPTLSNESAKCHAGARSAFPLAFCQLFSGWHPQRRKEGRKVHENGFHDTMNFLTQYCPNKVRPVLLFFR